MNRLLTQVRAELQLVARNGEQLLLTLGIPVMLLVFFSLVDVLPTGTDDPIDFLAPGVLALAVMSTAMVSLGIATGFERTYLVLKRLGATPLGRGRLIAAKIVAVVVVEMVQFAVLVPVSYALGWNPDSPNWAVALATHHGGSPAGRDQSCCAERAVPRAVAAGRHGGAVRQAAVGASFRRPRPAQWRTGRCAARRAHRDGRATGYVVAGAGRVGRRVTAGRAASLPLPLAADRCGRRPR
jgi:hypothetical protein